MERLRGFHLAKIKKLLKNFDLLIVITDLSKTFLSLYIRKGINKRRNYKNSREIILTDINFNELQNLFFLQKSKK